MACRFTHILSHINTIYVLRTKKPLIASEFITPEILAADHSRMRLKVSMENTRNRFVSSGRRVENSFHFILHVMFLAEPSIFITRFIFCFFFYNSDFLFHMSSPIFYSSLYIIFVILPVEPKLIYLLLM